MKKRHSIALRIFALFMALGCIAIGMVVSNVVTLQHLASSSETWGQKQLPVMVAAAKFAELGGQITTDATHLALAKSASALQEANQSLQNTLPKLSSLDPQKLSPKHHQEMQRLASELKENIRKIYANTEQKLLIQERQQQLRQQLYWAQIDFVDEVIPLTEESQFNLGLLMDKLEKSQVLSKSEFASLQFESNSQSQLLKLEADVNLVLDLLQRVSLFSSQTDILAAQSMIDETMVTIYQQISALKPLPSTVTIRQIASQLNDHVTGSNTPIQRALRVLSLDEGNQELLAQNRALIQSIRQFISEAVREAEAQATNTASSITDIVNTSRTQLNVTIGTIAILTIFVALYLKNQLLSRLATVLRSMRHLAQGELQTPLKIAGQDEVASLAHATNVFNQTARQLRQRTSALEEKNHQLLDEIEQRQQAENNLKETQEELVQAAKLAVLGQLTSGIVHEFSQPLAAIRSNSYLASQYLSKQQPEQAQEKLDRIERITDRATKLCQHLKSFARKTDDVTQRTYVYKAVINAIDLFTESLPEDWVTIDIPTDLCVRANEIRLEQVLVNAISNSLDAIQQRLGDDEFHPSISISAHQSTDWINLCITDNGCGMNQEQIDQIFEPFFTTKEVGSGLGLGMSITHNIIQDFGGTIFVQSEINKGTEVMVCLKPM
ncbi:two-component sensor histidine kinase [Vibrio sp. vnigr-6D03]|uniref:ATP-binding protein n=1 Tax=Vibrio sp. vnigr-6D03 TaxID=2058088 RepID=UPI000C31F68E|nr:ATP-binding protein [Vibrio sp. vnigr-6D03]PKF77700.1 two-component sensor histidine kinase [Vibrio sp. vnigr-6D03]